MLTQPVVPGFSRSAARPESVSRRGRVSPVSLRNVDTVTFSGSGSRSAGHLSGKTAVITGSTSGIGLAIARKLAGEGADIVMHGLEKRDEVPRGETRTVREMMKDIERQHGVKVHYVRANLANPFQMVRFADKVLAKTGRVDVLVNNAGFQRKHKLLDFPLKEFIDLMMIHAVAPFALTQKFVPSMKTNGWGRVINIASAHGLTASDEKFGYVAGKHAVVGLTKAMGIHLANDNITVNAVCPGYVGTPLAVAQLDPSVSEDEAKGKLMAKQARKEFTEPSEVADFVDFLTTDGARSINGAALSQDNGWMAGGS